jgi:hypothetical protein
MKILMTAILFVLGSSAAAAEQITFVATGTVVFASPDALLSGHLSYPVELGDQLRFSYTFESTTPGQSAGTYLSTYSAIEVVRVEVANNVVTFGPCSGCNNHIDVENDHWADEQYKDGYRAAAWDSLSSSARFVLLAFHAFGAEPIAALNTTALPIAPPNPMDFLQAGGEAVVFLAFLDNGVPSEIHAAITSLTIGSLKSPRELLTELAQAVVALNVQAGISNSLDSKLSNAIAALEDEKRGDSNSAISMLNAFINEVTAQRGVRLTDGQASQLVDMANAIIDAIGQP